MKAYIHLIKWLEKHNYDIVVEQHGVTIKYDTPTQARQCLAETYNSMVYVIDSNGEVVGKARTTINVPNDESVTILEGDVLHTWRKEYDFELLVC